MVHQFCVHVFLYENPLKKLRQTGTIYFSKLYPFITSSLLDNGPHYHNSAVILYLSEVNGVFNFIPSSEGKSQLDSHFAHISHKIVPWVRLGNDLESGQQGAELIKVQCGHFILSYMYTLSLAKLKKKSFTCSRICKHKQYNKEKHVMYC